MPGSSAAGAFTSRYSIDGRDVSLQQYNDRLKTFGILVKAKNFLVFQVGRQGRCCCSQPAVSRAALHTLSCWAAAEPPLRFFCPQLCRVIACSTPALGRQHMRCVCILLSTQHGRTGGGSCCASGHAWCPLLMQPAICMQPASRCSHGTSRQAAAQLFGGCRACPPSV